jgi:hypothetical protein
LRRKAGRAILQKARQNPSRQIRIVEDKCQASGPRAK